MIISKIKRAINDGLGFIGFHIIRQEQNTAATWLGIPNRQIDKVIDIGANKGQFAASALKKFPNASLFCFEPLPEAFKKLEKFIAEKNNNKVRLFNMALDTKEGSSEMFYHTEHSTSSSLLSTTSKSLSMYPFTEAQQQITVDVNTLDNILDAELHDTDTILVKMDVQGYEDRVIKGGKKVLKKANVCILEVCVDKLYDKQANFQDLTAMMYDLGFHYAGNLDQAYGEDGHCIFLDAVFTK